MSLLNIPVILRGIDLNGVSDFEFLVNDKIKVLTIEDLIDTLIACYTSENSQLGGL